MLGKVAKKDLLLKVNLNVKIVNCMIHGKALVTKALPEKLSQTMNKVIKVINYFKSNSLRTRIFASLCEAMNFDHKVRWLSKGKVPERVIFLRVEIVSFFATEDTYSFNFLHDEIWWLEVLLLNDLFNKLNILNLSLKGAEENIITITEKLKAFEKKLQYMDKKIG
jgi:hypothetical protein